MGFDKLNEVVAKLKTNGLRAQRGFPAEGMPQLNGTVAAVNLAAITPEQTQVAVQIFSSISGVECETFAQSVAETLVAMGAVYTAEKCDFDSRAGLFTCRVIGTWKANTDCLVRISGESLVYLTSVSVKRTISRTRVTDPVTEETVEECRDIGWNIALEEILPGSVMPDEDADSEFTVYIYRPNGYERFDKCKWVQISLETVANGLRRTRVARTWEDRQIFE